VTCDVCGGRLEIGMYPFCKGNPENHARGGFRNIPDDVPGGFWVENAWREPRHFDSQSAYEKALDASGLELRPHHVPGGKLARWSTMDAATMENARVLVARQGAAAKDPAVTLDTLVMQTRMLDETLTVRGEA
jgi:hypothetical protein